MIRHRFLRIVKWGVWAGLALMAQQLSGSGPKLMRPFPPHRLIVDKTALPLNSLAPLIVADDRLRLTGAWQLTSRDGKFGGLSAMMMAQGELLFLSDAGTLIRLHGPPDAPSNQAVMAPLPGPCGNSWNPGERDTESLALTPDGKQLRVGMETINAVCVINPLNLTKARRQPLAAMEGWRASYGPEAMASRPGKGTAIIGEGVIDPQTGASPLLWYQGDPADPAKPLIRMKYLPPKDHHPTDAVFLPDGRMVVLNRDFSRPFKFSSLLTLVPAFQPAAGLTVTGKVIARMDDPTIADNFEGVTATTDATGTTLWIVSDDNYFPLQRTLLLRFRMTEGAKPQAKP